MIQLTRLNGTPLIVNSDLIKTAEASPDTMLTLITGEKLIVREECGEVLQRATAYRAGLLAQVAQRLNTGLERIVSLSSLNLDERGNATPPENRSRKPFGNGGGSN